MYTLKNTRWSYMVMAIAGLLVFMSMAFKKPTEGAATLSNKTTIAKSFMEEKMELYESLNLDALGLSQEAFAYALTGFEKLVNAGNIRRDDILTILDFSLSSDKKRLFVINIASGELIFNTYAAHGRNSGAIVATRFSNKMNSYKSSLGFYITGETYTGKHGASLRLEGKEKGFNDNAMARGIVMHSAAYVNESIIAQQGYIGRSQGCPAIPANIYKAVIETIKNGTCLFMYSPDKYYTTHSTYFG